MLRGYTRALERGHIDIARSLYACLQPSDIDALLVERGRSPQHICELVCEGGSPVPAGLGVHGLFADPRETINSTAFGPLATLAARSPYPDIVCAAAAAVVHKYPQHAHVLFDACNADCAVSVALSAHHPTGVGLALALLHARGCFTSTHMAPLEGVYAPCIRVEKHGPYAVVCSTRDRVVAVDDTGDFDVFIANERRYARGTYMPC